MPAKRASTILGEMSLSGTHPRRELPPVAGAELLGRWVLAASILALAYGMATPSFSESGPATSLHLLLSARLGIFALAALTALLIQGAHPHSRLLWAGLLLAGWAAWGLLPLAETAGYDPEDSWRPSGGRFGMASARDLGLWQASLLGAVFLGTLLARGLAKPEHLLVVVLCAAAGDVWFNLMHVPESVSSGHPLRLLRLAWPPALERLHAGPSVPDLVFLALFMEAARRFRFSLPAVVMGALAGYAVASFLSLATWRIMLALPMVGLGVLMAVWTQIRCTARDVLAAFALALLLFALLLSLTMLRLRLHPPPRPRPDDFILRNVAVGYLRSTDK